MSSCIKVLYDFFLFKKRRVCKKNLFGQSSKEKRILFR